MLAVLHLTFHQCHSLLSVDLSLTPSSTYSPYGLVSKV